MDIAKVQPFSGFTALGVHPDMSFIKSTSAVWFVEAPLGFCVVPSPAGQLLLRGDGSWVFLQQILQMVCLRSSFQQVLLMAEIW